MHYEFPANIHINEVYDVINHHNERTGTKAFIAAHRGDHVVFNYLITFDGSFPRPNTKDAALNREYAILRECRGLIMDPETGRVLARRYHKFFNLGERDETLPQNLDFDKPHVILGKLDGSMVTPFRRADGSVSWGTKMGVTDIAKPVEAYVAAHPQYGAFAAYAMGGDWTPIFEWCSRAQRIIVDYPEDWLILTAMRHNRTGQYLDYNAMQGICATFDVPCVKPMPGSVLDGHAFMEETRDLIGAEGYVIRFHDGHMVKVKGTWYLQLHKTKELLQWEKDVWSLVLSERLDDAKAFMDEADRTRVDAFAQGLAREIAKTAERLSWVVIAARDNLGDSKKRFAIEVAAKAPSHERGLLFQIWDGREPVAVVRDYLRMNTGTQSKIEAVRHLVSGLNWNNYRGDTVDLAA